jgi:hypothetical protein
MRIAGRSHAGRTGDKSARTVSVRLFPVEGVDIRRWELLLTLTLFEEGSFLKFGECLS